MIGRKTVVSFSLLGALCFCAVAAQNALAVEGWQTNENTTGYVCESAAGALDFSDAHCDTSVTAGTGSFGHKVIPLGSETSTTITNEGTANKTVNATNTVLETVQAGAKVKVLVTEVHGLGWVKNVQPESGKHEIEGKFSTEYRSIMVESPKKCSSSEPVEFSQKVRGVQTANGEMGLEFTAEKGEVLVAFELLGTECPLKNHKFEFKGWAVSTGGAGATAKGSGATQVFSAANQNLEAGGEPASLTGTITTKVSGGGSPIALTTVT